jgi:hypothetical protein
MQTRDNGKQAVEEKRDIELENVVGNLFIDEYQVDRLRTRLSNLVYGYRLRMSNNKASNNKDPHMYSNIITNGIRFLL